MAIELLCRKVGMTRIFDEAGDAVPVTVLEAGPNAVVQVKTPERDGYAALQLGFLERRPKTLAKGVLGHYEKSGVPPRRWLRECRISEEEAGQYEPGQEIKADVFEAGQKVDVIGTSKGRGTAGTVKRHNFAVKRRTHGTHESFRHGGAIGAGAYPGKVIKGIGMFGRHGNARTTVRNLIIARVDAEKNVILVRGAVPGHPNALVTVRPAVAAKRG